MKKLLRFFLVHIAHRILLLYNMTLKYKIVGNPYPRERILFAFWHRNILPLMINQRYQNIVIMISASKDGELIALPAESLGYIPVRGSAGRNAITALKSMLKYKDTHSLSITPDGPKGPAKIIKDGVLFLAYMAKIPIVPTEASISSEWVINSWDRFRIPKPFATITVKYGEPIDILTKEDIEGKLAEVQKAMLDLGEE